jgi:hypothetical protein
MRIETRLDGSVAIRSSRSLRPVCFALGAAVTAAVLLEEPRDATRVGLGLLGALVPFALAALLERTVFDFDVTQRRLRWSRRNLFRALGGELPFDDIRDVVLRTRLETDSDTRLRVVHRLHRVALGTTAGEILLSNAWSGDERTQARVADAIRGVLGKSAAPPVEDSVEDMVAAGAIVDAVRLARERLGLSLAEATDRVNEMRGKLRR